MLINRYVDVRLLRGLTTLITTAGISDHGKLVSAHPASAHDYVELWRDVIVSLEISASPIAKLRPIVTESCSETSRVGHARAMQRSTNATELGRYDLHNHPGI